MEKRQTSIDCYNQIKAKGLLTKRRLEVYEAIYHSAPCTSSEAMLNRLNSSNVLSQSRARFTELRELGVIYEKGTKKCSVTGVNVIEWDLTDNLPINKKVITNTKKDRIKNALDALRQLYKNKDNRTNEDWKKVADLIKSI